MVQKSSTGMQQKSKISLVQKVNSSQGKLAGGFSCS
jgi:hypothetical protein